MKRIFFAGVSSGRSCRSSYNHSISASLALLVGRKLRWWSRRMCTHSVLQVLQIDILRLHSHQQENVGSHQKKIPPIQGQRRSLSKMVGEMRLHLESNPIPTRGAQRVQTKPCVPQDQETAQRQPDLCLSSLQKCRSAVTYCRGRDSGGSYLGHADYGINPLGGSSH